nr:glutamate--cysteine ligase [Quercus suber]
MRTWRHESPDGVYRDGEHEVDMSIFLIYFPDLPILCYFLVSSGGFSGTGLLPFVHCFALLLCKWSEIMYVRLEMLIPVADVQPLRFLKCRAVGTPLDWPEAKKVADHVREWGIEQLLAIWRRAKGKKQDALLWGDEIEYLVVALDDEQRKVTLSLRQADILEALANNAELLRQGGGVPDLARGSEKMGKTAPTFHPEFGRFMLEATPGKPWGIGFKDLLDVEQDMKWRRSIAKDHMYGNEYPITLTTFPLLGDRKSITPCYKPSGSKLRSQFVPDEIANPHIRFPTLAANIRSRRGRKVELNVPVYHDEKTSRPWKDPTVDYDLHNWPEDDDVRNGAAKDDHIYMDAMAFGMGSCCLQITFQAKGIEEGRKMYDQLSPIGPILLALTAATPIYKGFLADTDVRWNQISRAVDDRTPEELGETPLKHDRWRIPKSRYASNSTYISQDPRLRKEYLDPDLVIDEKLKARLVEGGMDDVLATHFAHLFIRDPIVVFNEDLKELDLSKTDHFENLQSTNWQHMRFKPPPPGNDIGWRVEVRPMEIQITDFENAAFSVFVVLITRAILSFDLNFYLPIPRTTENMETAHRRDAVLHDKFYFRKNVMPRRPTKLNNSTTTSANSSAAPSGANTPQLHSSRPPSPVGPVEDEYELMTVDEIINGQPDGAFPGLIPLVESYLDSVNVDVETRCEIARYLALIKGRASGKLWTAAKWIRHYVRAHPDYHMDSVVSEGMTYDLIKAVERITSQEGRDGFATEMLGNARQT